MKILTVFYYYHPGIEVILLIYKLNVYQHKGYSERGRKRTWIPTSVNTQNTSSLKLPPKYTLEVLG